MDDQVIESLHKVIAARRSISTARLKPDPIDSRIIEEALIAANWAPSHGETEPWRFHVFTGESRINLGQTFAEAYQQSTADSQNFKSASFEAYRQKPLLAPVWISIAMQPGLNPDGSRKKPEIEEVMAVACAVQNLHLALTAYGVAGKWHSKNVSIHPHVAEFLGLTPPTKLLGFFYCGYPAIEWPEGKRQPWRDKVTFSA